ncbi:hypothetical protein GCM10016234_09040 [Tianweitania populi]|uniref:Uncharacterized protein n=1 Tax=Tianweitania populi TaxID=1607949 RepID=A0A8J3DM95_9HYPH|nr:hypothetical protein GCM10016234_09040 [Tianweitania populi]
MAIACAGSARAAGAPKATVISIEQASSRDLVGIGSLSDSADGNITVAGNGGAMMCFRAFAKLDSGNKPV